MIVCGTGHRPNKLGGYSPDAHTRLVVLAIDWLVAQHAYFPDRELEVISGGALGWDQALAQAAWMNNVPFMFALPFEGFETKWPSDSQHYLKRLMDSATRVHYVCEPGYSPWKMQKRNEWMVDNSDQVLALWDGSDGGTANCVKYANKVGKPITNLWEQHNVR